MDQNTHDPFSPVQASSSLAITGFVLSLIALVILPPLGIVGLILSAIAWNRASQEPDRYEGKGFAIAGTIIGALCTLLSCLLVILLPALILPALGTARESAREIKSMTQVRAIATAMVQYQQQYSVEVPADADWQDALSFYLPADIFIAPGDEDPSTPSYFRIVWPESDTPQTGRRIVIVEDPALRLDSTIIGYSDGAAEVVDDAELRRLLQNADLPPGLRLP